MVLIYAGLDSTIYTDLPYTVCEHALTGCSQFLRLNSQYTTNGSLKPSSVTRSYMKVKSSVADVVSNVLHGDASLRRRPDL